MYIHIYTYVYIFVGLYVGIDIHTCTYIMNTYTYIYICMCILIWICVYLLIINLNLVVSGRNIGMDESNGREVAYNRRVVLIQKICLRPIRHLVGVGVGEWSSRD